MRGMLSVTIVGILAIIGFALISAILTSGILTGTDVGTRLMTTLYPLVYAFVGMLALLGGLYMVMRIFQGRGGGGGEME